MAGAHRTILHVDMDAFFASVEQRDDPALRDKPVLVGGDGPRGVVAAASYEARQFGCRSAMPMAVAKRLCPHAIIVKGRFDAYREASDTVMAMLEEITPVVQPVSIDEAYLDATGSERLFGDGLAIARRIKTLVKERTELVASVGVAPNKFVAKIASDLDKPDGLRVITPEEMLDTLGALPVGVIPGLGPAAEEKLHRLGARTVADLRELDEQTLESRFGVWGARLWQLARAIDDRPVTPERDAKSIGREQTFGQDLTDRDEVRAVLLRHVEHVARRVRKHGLQGRAVTLKIRFGDFRTITRSATLDEATDGTDDLWRVSRDLFDDWAKSGFEPVRLIGMSAGRFGDAQGGLFGAGERAKRSAADRAADAVKERFGDRAIARAGALRPRRQP